MTIAVKSGILPFQLHVLHVVVLVQILLNLDARTSDAERREAGGRETPPSIQPLSVSVLEASFVRSCDTAFGGQQEEDTATVPSEWALRASGIKHDSTSR